VPTYGAESSARTQEKRGPDLTADDPDPRHDSAKQLKEDQDARLQLDPRLAKEDDMRKWMYLPAAMTLVSFSISAHAQGPAQHNRKGEDAKVLIARNTTPQPPKPATLDPGYSIAPEDVLTIDVWKEPEISRTVPVRRDGKISLPLLDDVQAAGLTPTQLSSEIVEKLQATVVHPQVTVIVAQMSSQRIYILGQVNRGGAYPLVPDMKAMQALSIAGGFTPFANVKKINPLAQRHRRFDGSGGGDRDQLPSGPGKDL
jgi:polysaccharide export outer membrane protein